ncbi:hypothetical protein GCM10009827_097230 [Dactylosporangium maewongense]|uniref:HEAT repeat protein n=1 Tax=Dactylosporangium maewongense TaxID=634393 RepID=A0ABP4NHG4_9ACTN
MLEGLDEVDWSMYRGAYGPCTEAPDILRAMASPDPEAARQGHFGFASSFWNQETVYPVTVQVVPFLIELATADGVHERDQLLQMLGALTDPEQCDGPDAPAVRQAVVAGSVALLPQADDPDPSVRAAAAYVLGRCGGHTVGALRRRWDTETDPEVRAELLLAIAHNGGASGELLWAAAAEAGLEPAAVALAYAKAGLPLPPATVAAVAGSFAAGSWHTPWSVRGGLARGHGTVRRGVRRRACRRLAAHRTAWASAPGTCLAHSVPGEPVCAGGVDAAAARAADGPGRRGR